MPETTKKPIKIVPNTIKTIPKIAPATIIPKKTLEEQLEEIYDDIDVNVDDLPDELLEVYEELEGDYKEKAIQKNWKLWLTMFTPFILPAFIKGVSGQVTLPYDARQSVQSNAPEPKVVVDYAKKYFEEHGLELVKTLSQTDCERLKVQLKDNWGKGPTEFKKSFEEDYANTKARLDSIYRTEYVTAQNEGILARSRDAGHKMKQWNAALDERTCPVCGDQLHGTIIPIEEEFTAVVEHKNGSEEISVNGPPAHVNCRCVLTTLDEDDYDEIKEDSAYLDNVTDFIKLNYKCEFNGTDNKCGLDPDKNTDSNVIAGYVRNDNKLVNSILSGDYDLSEKDENHGLEKIRLLDNIFKDKLLPEKEITYRGISKSNIKNLPDNWNKIGNAISPGTFLSTSRSRSEAEGFITGGSNDDSILIKLILPRNTNAINVSDFVPKTSAYAYSFDENEVLVDRNTEFKVVDYRIENSRNMGELHIATWEAIPDNPDFKEVHIDNNFKMEKELSNITNIDKVREKTKELDNKITEEFGSGPDNDSSPEEIARYTNMVNELSQSNKIHEDAIKAYNRNAPDLNNPKNERDQKHADQLKETLDSVELTTPVILWRGERQNLWNELSNAKSATTDRFVSLTQEKVIAEQFKEDAGSFLIKYELPVGSHALPTWSFVGTEAPNELEWILNKDSKINVTNVDKENKVITVRVVPEKVKEDSAYISDAFETIKQNYKCKAGTVDDSNKCDAEQTLIAKSAKLEAIERIAARTLGNTIENSVNFDGFSESRASKIADHLNIIKERAQVMGVPMFERVGTRNIPKMQMATMHGVVGLNPKEIDSIIKERKEGKQTGTIIDYFKNEDKIISLLLDHEFGHQILENMDPDLQSITHAKFNPDTPKPVAHMNQNSDEWFADNYALYVNGKKSLVDKQLKLLFSVIIPERQKQNNSYLEDVTNFIKLNYNCPADEKVGTGPGSCSNGQTTSNQVISPEVSSKNLDISVKIVGDNERILFTATTNDNYVNSDWTEKAMGKRQAAQGTIDLLPDKTVYLNRLDSNIKGKNFGTESMKAVLQELSNKGYTSARGYTEINNFEGQSLIKRLGGVIESETKDGIYWKVPMIAQAQNSTYLSEASDFIKLNYNCPDSEKNGTGPGSCGGNTDSKININPEIAPADYNSFFENFNKISKDKSEPDRVMRRLNAETVQRRFYRKTEEHFNEIKLENDKKLKENGEKLWDNLRPEVQSAIKSYTTQDYGVINSALQDGITREEVSLLKEATSKPLGVSTILYRGINFKMPKDIFKVGATWIHKPFASCSTGSFIAEEAASGKLTHITPEEKTILQIFTEPETKGFAVGKNSFHAGADAGSEVILDAGTKFQTIHSEKRGGMRILTVRAINDEQKQDSSYLEDATNFIKLNYNCPDSEKNGTGPGSCGGSKTTDSNIDDNNNNINWFEKESFKKLYDDWKTGIYVSDNQDLELKELIQDRGFDKKPKIITENELTTSIKNGNIELYRGFSSDQTIEQFKNGDYYIGKGLYGNGTYMANNPDTAKLYGTNTLHMALDKSAKIISEKTLHDEQQKFINILDQQKKYTPEHEENDNKISLLIHLAMDNGRFATLKGYDAIQLSGGNMIILNRGKLIVSDVSENKQKRDSSYLENVSEFMKLNYKCKAGTVDDSNKCGLEQENTKNSNFRLPTSGIDRLITAQRTNFGHSFIDTSTKSGPSNLGYDESTPILENLIRDNNLDIAVLKQYNDLSKLYSWGDGQDAVRDKVRDAIVNNNDLGKFILAKSELEEYAYKKYIDNIPLLAEKQYNEDLDQLSSEIEVQKFVDNKTITKWDTILDRKVTEKVPLYFRDMSFDTIEEAKSYINKSKEQNSKIPSLYRKGKYHSSFLESYTPSEEGTGQFKNPNIKLTEDTRIQEGWRIFSGIIGVIGEPDEHEITLININDIKQRQDSACLADAFETIKLNYKCPKGTVDDSNKCNPEEQEKSNISDSKHASETFIGFKADHDFSSTPEIEIDKHIQTSLDKASESLKKISKNDRQVLTMYSGGRFHQINEYLNGSMKDMENSNDVFDKAIVKESKQLTEKLDKLFTNSDLSQPLVTYRGISNKTLSKYPELLNALDTPGSEIEFPCFSSTSVLPFMANNYTKDENGETGRLLELQLPSGTKALFIGKDSLMPKELEVLINRGTKFEVGKTKYTDIVPPNSGIYRDTPAKHVKITTIRAIV